MGAVWEMNRMQGKNPSHTASFFNGYDPRGFTASQVLARESGQNSLDAGENCPGLTEIQFYWLRASGEGKKDILSLLEFDKPLKDRLGIYESLGRYRPFCSAARDLFEKDDIEFLLIRDLNTCGLGGRWNRFEKGDHFSRLVCALNLDDKSDGSPNSGGSFGLGKTAYSNSSSVNTVLYHSVFKTTADTDGANRRLMVAGVYPRHTIDDDDYGGFAYWGEKAEPGLDEARPYENEEALENWELVLGACGRDDLLRGDDQHGTDILIFQPSVNMSELKHAIEENYWPAIIQRKLSVTLYDADGEQHHPAPLARPDLKPFIKLFQRAESGETEKSETCIIEALRNRHERKTGVIAMEAADDLDNDDQRLNAIALMRGTGMVINYMVVGSARFEPVRGVYIADPDIYAILSASENIAHSEWNPESRRLYQVYGTEGVDVVKWVHGSIRNRVQTFQKALQPKAPNRSNEHGFFAKLMSQAFSGTGDSAPDPGRPNLVSISLTRQNREHNRSIWRLRITDNEHTPDTSFKLTIKPSISICGDAKRVPLKRRDITLKLPDGTILEKGSKPELEIDFQRGAVFDGIMELDAPGEHNYSAACRGITLTKVEAERDEELLTGQEEVGMNAIQ